MARYDLAQEITNPQRLAEEYQPSLGDVIGAYSGEAFTGVGTLYYNLLAKRAAEGSPITK